MSWLLGLPFAVARTFGVEQRFGFNRTRPGAFALDRLKSAALSLAIGVPLLFGLMALMRQQGPWWVSAWLGLLLLMLAFVGLSVGIALGNGDTGPDELTKQAHRRRGEASIVSLPPR